MLFFARYYIIVIDTVIVKELFLMQNNSKKLLAIILAVVMVCSTLALVACSGETEFVNPSMPSSSTVESNGGMAVGYGDYIYYVNGIALVSSATNGYTGEVKYGDIVRISTDKLEEALALTEDDADEEEVELEELLQDFMRDNVEVVVPYFFYTSNTTDTTVNGLYIFGDRLYFTTPNNEVTSNGDVLYSELVVCSTELDGSDYTAHHVVEDNTTAIMLAEVDDTVHATYVLDGDLVTVDLTTDTSTTVAETIGTYQFNGDSVYYMTEDGSIAAVTGGGEEEILVENTDDSIYTYTVVSVNDGCVYYTLADSSKSVSSTTLNMVNRNGDTAVVLDSTTDASGTAYTFLGYKEGVVMTSTTANTDVSAYQLYLTSGDISDKTFVIPFNTNDGAITLVSIEGDVLTYTINSLYYTVDLSADTFVIEEHGAEIAMGSYSTYFTSDTVGEYTFVMDDNGDILVYTQTLDDDDEWETYGIAITLLVEEDEDE